MKISRRDFLKWSAASAIALKLNFDMDRLNTVMAADSNPPVIWLQGAGCSGCSISTLNVTNPTTIDDVLLNKVSMKFHPDIGTYSGESAMQAIDKAASQYDGQFILVLEGAVHTGNYENYCIIGQLNGVDVTMYDVVMKYGPMAKYVVSAGTCASFGGVAKAGINSATCSDVKSLLSGKTRNAVVNLPGCPVHPTVLVQTLLDLILTGVPALDTSNRPTKYFSTRIHRSCPRKEGGEAKQPGVVGCYEELGCKGKSCMSSPCPSASWNNGRGWCIGVNYPCIGCADAAFPTSPLIGGGGSGD